MTTLNGIDFTQDGKQFGHLEIPHSTHRSAYGKIMVPVVYLKNGNGPRAMISAGVHGDEYEGQITLRKLAFTLSVKDITGSLILLPMANAPAAVAARRTSSIDDGNLNRLFPGNPTGQPTEAIAHAIENLLLAECNFAYDIHSGGSSLLYDAIAITTATGSPKDDAVRLGLLNALGVPSGMVLSATVPMGLDASLDGAMLRQNVVGVSVEFGGGGALSPCLLSQCEGSVYRFLRYVDILRNAPAEAESIGPCELFDITDPNAHVFSHINGIFEHKMSVGESVSSGDLLGTIYNLDELEREPFSVISEIAGTVLCFKATPSVQKGDCLFQIGQSLKHPHN